MYRLFSVVQHEYGFCEGSGVQIVGKGMSGALQVYHNIIQHCISKKLYQVSSPDFENKSRITAWAVQNHGNW